MDGTYPFPWHIIDLLLWISLLVVSWVVRFCKLFILNVSEKNVIKLPPRDLNWVYFWSRQHKNELIKSLLDLNMQWIDWLSINMTWMTWSINMTNKDPAQAIIIGFALLCYDYLIRQPIFLRSTLGQFYYYTTFCIHGPKYVKEFKWCLWRDWSHDLKWM